MRNDVDRRDDKGFFFSVRFIRKNTIVRGKNLVAAKTGSETKILCTEMKIQKLVVKKGENKRYKITTCSLSIPVKASVSHKKKKKHCHRVTRDFRLLFCGTTAYSPLGRPISLWAYTNVSLVSTNKAETSWHLPLGTYMYPCHKPHSPTPFHFCPLFLLSKQFYDAALY